MLPIIPMDDSTLADLRASLLDTLGGNEPALVFLDLLERDPEVQGLLTHGNTLAIGRLNYNDHGPIHSRIASLNALRILSLLNENGIAPTVVRERWGTFHDAQIVVLGATYLHDIGNSVHRDNHHDFALMFANPILTRLLPIVYDIGTTEGATGSGRTVEGKGRSRERDRGRERDRDIEKLHRVRASILECIFSHDESVRCLSIEAGCVTAGDGADMANGRARIPFSLGKVDIHSVSAMSIRSVTIGQGDKKPVLIEVIMSESAGVFQIQNVLGRKLESSGLRDLIEVRGKVISPEHEVVGEIVF